VRADALQGVAAVPVVVERPFADMTLGAAARAAI
jgi:hypothetical protein